MKALKGGAKPSLNSVFSRILIMNVWNAFNCVEIEWNGGPQKHCAITRLSKTLIYGVAQPTFFLN